LVCHHQRRPAFNQLNLITVLIVRHEVWLNNSIDTVLSKPQQANIYTLVNLFELVKVLTPVDLETDKLGDYLKVQWDSDWNPIEECFA
jgi:hypothetical protein